MKDLSYSRSPFINLARRLEWTASIWLGISQYLYWLLIPGDLDCNSKRYRWFIKPVHSSANKVFRFNNWWQNKIGKLFCRHVIKIDVDPYENVGETYHNIYSYLDENNPSRWYWIHIVEEKQNSYSSIQYSCDKIEVSFMFKNEAIMYRLKYV